ncbi:MAG: extracellular solute-binding protein [Hydrogenoanaerobacterium sp.]
MKKFICAALALMLAAGLTGCGSTPAKKSESENSSESSNSSNSSESSKSESTPPQSDTLVIYSPLPPKLLQAAADNFSAASGTEVTIISDSSTALLARIADKAEPKADVLFGAGAEVVRANSQQFTPYAGTENGALDPLFLPADELYTPLTPMPIVLMYNKSQTTQPPTGWANIINSSYRGWVAFASPFSSGTSYTALCITQQLKKVLGSEYLNSFCTSIAGKMLPGISDVYKGVANAEFAVGVTLESSAQKYIDAGYQNVGIVYPVEGTTAALEVSAIVADTKKEADARSFIDYVSGAEFQKLLVSEYKLRTARNDIADPEGLTPRRSIKFMAYDMEKAVNDRSTLLKKFNEYEKKATAALDTSN